MDFRHKPNPYPKFDSGPGITLGYPNFGYPIPTLVHSNQAYVVATSMNCFSLTILYLFWGLFPLYLANEMASTIWPWSLASYFISVAYCMWVCTLMSQDQTQQTKCQAFLIGGDNLILKYFSIIFKRQNTDRKVTKLIKFNVLCLSE